MGEGLLEQDDDDAGFCMRTRRLMSGTRVWEVCVVQEREKGNDR